MITNNYSLTINGYECKLNKPLKFYQGDSLHLIFTVNQYEWVINNGNRVRAIMPINPLRAFLIIENPEDENTDTIESAFVENDEIHFHIDSKYTSFVGVGRMQLVLADDGCCSVTIPEFTYEIKKNITDKLLHLSKTTLIDTDNKVLMTDSGDDMITGLALSTESNASKYIKDLPNKEAIDGQESVLIQDQEGTKNVNMKVLLDDINSRTNLADIQNQITETNTKLSENDAKIVFLEKMKLKHVYRAKALGGDVDNHIAIANAIRNDKCVYFPAGEYEIEDEILIENIDGIVITGDSDVRLVKRQAKKKLFIFKYCNDVTFSDIHFYEKNINITSLIENSQAINFNIGCSGLKVNGCTFKNFADCCIVDRTQSVNKADYELTTSVKNSKSIISSCLFENCVHTYLTKSGGGKNIIYSDNIHTDCIAGIKIDGEVFNVDGTSTTYEDFAGNAIVNGNIFYKSKLVDWNAYSCVEVEEKSKNTLITSNLFIENNTPSIHLKFGQSRDDVNEVLISTNQFTNNNEFDVIIRGEGVALYKNINVVNNDFSNCRKNMIYVVMPHSETLNGLNISSNRFYSEVGLNYSFIQVNGGERLKNILIKNNDFVLEGAGRILTVENLRVDSDEDFIISDNTFKSRVASSDAIELINTVALVANNKFIKCDLKLRTSEVLILENTFNNSIINTIHSDRANNLLLFENKFKKGDRIGNYMVAIRDGGNHEGFGNVFIGGLADPIYEQNGSYVNSEYVVE